MYRWLTICALTLGILTQAHAACILPVKKGPTTRFYDPAPALTGGYYDTAKSNTNIEKEQNPTK